MVVNIIHSGLPPESIKLSINFNLLIARSSATFDFNCFTCSESFTFSSSKFRDLSISSIASAPIPAVKASSPNLF